MVEATNTWRTPHFESRHAAVFATIALAATAAIFAVDTYANIQGAVAVLYVIALLLIAEATTKNGILSMTGLCIGLAVLSYVITHGTHPDLQTAMRLTVALAALCVTAALLFRNDDARSNLLLSNIALRESESRYRSIFDLTRVALWEQDYSQVRTYLMDLKAHGMTDIREYTRVHPETLARCIAMIGIVASNDAAVELLGPKMRSGPADAMKSFISPSDATFLSILQAILDEAQFFENETEVKSDTGEAKRVLFSISFPDNPAAYNRVVVSMVDITQREYARKALAQAQTELINASKAATVGVLSASLAHELNQPLGAIVVNSETLLRWLDRDPPDLAAVRRSAERIIRDSQRASTIIQNTRYMLSHTEQSVEPVDLLALVTETLMLMEHDLQKDRAVVEIMRGFAVPPIYGVKIEVQQVLINLITNAVQAMNAAESERRMITVALGAPRDSKMVSISVRDTGPGLSEDALEKIFSPFYTTKESGMGLGLSICRSTVEARGGSLIASNHLNGGAVFEINLPREVENA